LPLFIGIDAEVQKNRLTDKASRWVLEQVCSQRRESDQDIYTCKMGADSIFRGRVYERVEIPAHEMHNLALTLP
jgi:hypothetical protein